jgi:hypothetical protein
MGMLWSWLSGGPEADRRDRQAGRCERYADDADRLYLKLSHWDLRELDSTSRAREEYEEIEDRLASLGELLRDEARYQREEAERLRED